VPRGSSGKKGLRDSGLKKIGEFELGIDAKMGIFRPARGRKEGSPDTWTLENPVRGVHMSASGVDEGEIASGERKEKKDGPRRRMAKLKKKKTLPLSTSLKPQAVA